MRKKILVLAMILCLSLTACGDKSESAKNKTENNSNQLTVTDGAIDVTLDDDFDSCKEELGEPTEYCENKSCLYDGYDKTYTYENLVIITYPINDKEKIASITVLSADVKHNLPISIGDSLDDIKSEYGEDNLDITDGCCMYEDEYGIAFYMEDDVVIEIEIYIL